jgi:hypothetical protein
MAQVGCASGEELKKAVGCVAAGVGFVRVAELDDSPGSDFSSTWLCAVLEGDDRLGAAVPYG